MAFHPSEDPGGYFSGFSGVAAVSASDVWAVGGADQSFAFIERWNGRSWSIVPSPNAGAFLSSVAAVSASDVWAVGTDTARTVTEHWNGSHWSIVPSPNPNDNGSELRGVAAVAASNVWSVGSYYKRTPSGSYEQQTLTEHWNGSHWLIVPSPNLSGFHNLLYSVAAVSASDVWAVGERFNASFDQTLIEHWNGNRWSIVSSPNSTSTDALTSVAAVSTSNAWAVGYYVKRNPDGTNSHQTLTEHWNGSGWSVVRSPSYNYSELRGVAAVAASDIWAVGSVGGGQLIEHFHC